MQYIGKTSEEIHDIFVDAHLDLDEDIEFMDDYDNINDSINNTEEFNEEDNLIMTC
jgi:hypothetical protein